MAANTDIRTIGQLSQVEKSSSSSISVEQPSPNIQESLLPTEEGVEEKNIEEAALVDLHTQSITTTLGMTVSADISDGTELSNSVDQQLPTTEASILLTTSTQISLASIPIDVGSLPPGGKIDTALIDTALIETVLITTPTAASTTVAFSETNQTRVQRTVRVPILMYHYLSVPPGDADIYRLDLSVTPEQFALHLDAMLDEGYQTISLFDLWNYLENGAELPAKPVVITFDDGYLDNYENAFPLLIQRGMTATFFIVTDFLETNRPGYMTWSMVREMFDAGMSMESHGINHYSLKNRDYEFLVFQALRSKELIEARIGTTPRFVSYPAGEYDQATINIFSSANYLMGVTTIQGSTHTNDNFFELRRVRVRGTTDTAQLLELLTLDW